MFVFILRNSLLRKNCLRLDAKPHIVYSDLVSNEELQSHLLQSLPQSLCVISVSPPTRLQALQVVWSVGYYNHNRQESFQGLVGAHAAHLKMGHVEVHLHNRGVLTGTNLFSYQREGFPEGVEVAYRSCVMVPTTTTQQTKSL